jgi:uncharacterized membrane protein
MGCCGGGRHRGMEYGHYGSHGHRSNENDNQTSHAQRAQVTSPTPLELLKTRLAKGEITMSEYQEIAQALSS